MTLPNRSRAWRTAITSVTGTATSTQTFSLGSVNGRPTLPFTAAVVKRGQDANPGTHEEITITAMTANAVTACTRAANGTTAISLEVGDSIYQSVAALLDAYEAVITGGFVVDGVNYAATRTGVQAAITAAGAAGGGHVDIAVDLTWDTTAVTLPSTGNIELSSRPGVTLSAPAAGVVAMFFPAGTKSAASALTSNAARLGRSIVHTPADAARLLAVGDMLQVHDATTGQKHSSIVSAVSASSVGVSQTVTFTDPLSQAFTTANSSVVYKVAPLSNVYIHDLRFDANSNTSSLVGFSGQMFRDSSFERLSFSGFKGSGVSSVDVAGGMGIGQSYHCTFRNLSFEQCGTTGLAAFQEAYNTGCTTEDVLLMRGGFGYEDTASNHFYRKNIRGLYNNGRSIAVGAAVGGQASFDGVMVNCWGNHSIATYNGIAFRGGSAYIEIHGGGCLDNDGSGLYIVGTTAEHDLTFFGGNYSGNHITSGYDMDDGATTAYNIKYIGTKRGTHNMVGTGTQVNNTLFQATGTSVVNNAAETTTFTAGIPASFLSLYNALRLTFQGVIANNAGNRTIDIAVKYGGTTLFKDTTAVIGASANNRPFSIVLTLRNAGATNDQRLTGLIGIGGIAGATTGAGDLGAAGILAPAPIYGSATEDSTTALTFLITVTMSANDFSFIPINAIPEVIG